MFVPTYFISKGAIQVHLTSLCIFFCTLFSLIFFTPFWNKNALSYAKQSKVEPSPLTETIPKILANLPPEILSKALEQLTPEELMQVLTLLPTDLSANILADLLVKTTIETETKKEESKKGQSAVQSALQSANKTTQFVPRTIDDLLSSVINSLPKQAINSAFEIDPATEKKENPVKETLTSTATEKPSESKLAPEEKEITIETSAFIALPLPPLDPPPNFQIIQPNLDDTKINIDATKSPKETTKISEEQTSKELVNVPHSVQNPIESKEKNDNASEQDSKKEQILTQKTETSLSDVKSEDSAKKNVETVEKLAEDDVLPLDVSKEISDTRLTDKEIVEIKRALNIIIAHIAKAPLFDDSKVSPTMTLYRFKNETDDTELDMKELEKSMSDFAFQHTSLKIVSPLSSSVNYYAHISIETTQARAKNKKDVYFIKLELYDKEENLKGYWSKKTREIFEK